LHPVSLLHTVTMPKKFETERTRHWRSTQLVPEDERTISNIEKYGCAVISVKSKLGRAYGWTYTIGVYDTCGKPDLITVGLDPEVAHSCLNNAVKRLRSGVDIVKTRQADLIGDVDCEFRPVDPKWIKRFMNWANWYYGNSEFPVLQAVYPDLQNRFPENDDFNVHFKQPLMQPSAAMTPTEEDFWAADDQNSSLFDWKFPDPPHTGVYLSKAVNNNKEPITYVSHDPDGDWQFLGDTMTETGGVLVCLHHPIDTDPTLKELADLPIGWYAERVKPGEPWTRSQHQPENDLDKESS
jgi:hypothetical protein